MVKQEKNVPKWLKEVLDRGFQPSKIYRVFENSLFKYVKNFSSTTHNFPNKLIFALEGIPGSGKTSILKMFGNTKGIKTVLQILPHEPVFDQVESLSFYLKSEELKTKAAISSSERLILMDRYYVSTLAFYWAYDQVHGTKVYPNVLQWYRKAIASGKILKPFKVFYINTPIDIGTKRKQRELSDKLKNLWLNRKFLKAFVVYYGHFYSAIEKSTQVVRLSGTDSLTEIRNKIKEKIDEYQK